MPLAHGRRGALRWARYVVLLVIAHGVDRPQEPALLLREFQVLRREPDTLLEPNGAAGRLVKDPHALLPQSGFEEHLQGVLEVQQDGCYATIVIEVIENPSRTAKRGEGLRLEQPTLSVHHVDERVSSGRKSLRTVDHHACPGSEHRVLADHRTP
jgi:hypothetical protein